MNLRHPIALATALVALTASAAATAQVIPDPDGDHVRLYSAAPASDKAQPEFVRYGNNSAVWPGAVYRWSMNPNGLPAAVTVEQFKNTIELAMSRWSGVCNIRFEYVGTSSAIPRTYLSTGPDGINVIAFVDFAQYNMSNTYAGLTFTHFYQPGPNIKPTVIQDSDIALNPTNPAPWTQANLDGALMHELGHVLGLDHSDTTVSIMSNNPYHSAQYSQMLRADDIAGCVERYGAAPDQLTHRVLNWAEDTYQKELKKVGGNSPQTTTGYGYLYRYYPGSNTYAGSKDGRAYYRGADGSIQDMGTLMDFAGRVDAAGF